MSSTKESLPFGRRLRYVLCNYHKSSNCWSILLPEAPACQCLGVQLLVEKEYGFSLGSLSLLILLPEKWAVGLLVLIVTKRRHTWLEVARFVFWDVWTDSEYANLKTKNICASIVALSVALLAVCWIIVRCVLESNLLKAVF